MATKDFSAAAKAAKALREGAVKLRNKREEKDILDACQKLDYSETCDLYQMINEQVLIDIKQDQFIRDLINWLNERIHELVKIEEEGLRDDYLTEHAMVYYTENNITDAWHNPEMEGKD